MGRGGVKYLFILLACWALAATGHAQYYDQGVDPASVRWRQIKDPGYRLIFPAGYEHHALRVASIIDTLGKEVGFGLSMPPARLPFIMHAYDLNSNGEVVWAPKRVELTVTPERSTYAWPWLEQLTTHEYRHVVQMSNLRQGTLKYASWVFGQQIIGAGAGLLPKWFLEGDAVHTETRLAAFGRALQPSYTIEYRAMLEHEGVDQWNIDKWYCGSFRDYIPDWYAQGYQMVDYSYRRFGQSFWDDVTRFTAYYPFLIVPKAIAMQRYYKTSSSNLMRESFGELQDYWRSLPKVENSAGFVGSPATAYTKYAYPVRVDDDAVVAFKTDFDRATRLVAVNLRHNEERVLAYTGNVTSRPAVDTENGRIFWTEGRSSTFWERENFSVVRTIALQRLSKNGTYKVRTIDTGDDRNLFYITIIPRTPHQQELYLALAYDPAGIYSLKKFDAAFELDRTIPLPEDRTYHGMAWDDSTKTLALITLTADGMAIEQWDEVTQTLHPITRPSFVTINNLTAGGGKLFFNSIASGKDETHLLDLAEKKEYRVTTSKFGSIQPSYSDLNGEEVFQLTYRRDGYFVSRQALDRDSLTEVPYSRLPVNLLNPEHPEWDTLNIRSAIRFAEQPAAPKKSKRYSQWGHLFNIHSWAPFAFDPFELTNDRNLDLNFGATVISQNVLGSAMGFLSYGRVDGENLYKGQFGYYGLAPKIEVGFEYGGGSRSVLIPGSVDPDDTPEPENAGDDYLSLSADLSLPINLSRGRQLRQLTPSVGVDYYNALLYDPATRVFDEGYQVIEGSLAYAQNVRTAYRDLYPRWGFGGKFTWQGDPFRDQLGQLYSLTAGMYAPGALIHHSLRVNAAVQYQQTATYNMRNNVLFPKGCKYDFAPERLAAVSVRYRFPVAYPDGGIAEWIYFKRISAGLILDYARYKPVSRTSTEWKNASSYGVEALIDVDPARMVGSGVRVTMSLYKPSDSPDLGFSFGISVSF